VCMLFIWVSGFPLSSLISLGFTVFLSVDGFSLGVQFSFCFMVYIGVFPLGVYFAYQFMLYVGVFALGSCYSYILLGSHISIY